ncbi:hypothetical protein HMPREF6745_1266 [Prevotella sp. oral taxon 472 str. F0295]|nr:hypothetical protein HMPREF6745_1266 [Prevotella sp. oral taxon 472 str. F0295]
MGIGCAEIILQIYGKRWGWQKNALLACAIFVVSALVLLNN